MSDVSKLFVSFARAHAVSLRWHHFLKSRKPQAVPLHVSRGGRSVRRDDRTQTLETTEMGRDSGRTTAGERVPCFEVTSTSEGRYDLRAVADLGARANKAGTPAPDSNRVPPNMTFLSAKDAIEQSEDCDAHLRELLGSLRRLGPNGTGSIANRVRTTTTSSADATTPVAERLEVAAKGLETQRIPEIELAGSPTDGMEVRRVPETEFFPEYVKCSLDPDARGGLQNTCSAPDVGDKQISRAENSDVPDILSMSIEEENAHTRIPETLFPEELDEQRDTEGLPADQIESKSKSKSKSAKNPTTRSGGVSTRKAPLDMRGVTRVLQITPVTRRTPGTRTPAHSKKPMTPFTELQLTEDGLFSPSSEFVDPKTDVKVRPDHNRNTNRNTDPSDLPSPFGEVGALQGEGVGDELESNRYFADMHRQQTKSNSENKEGTPFNPRLNELSKRHRGGFTYPSPAQTTPWQGATYQAGTGTGTDIRSLGFNDWPYGQPNLQSNSRALQTPKRVGNLTAPELVAMRSVPGAVTIRTADVEMDGVGEEDGLGGLGDTHGDVPAPETVVVPDTYTVEEDRDDSTSEHEKRNHFVFHGGSEEPVPSPVAMAINASEKPQRSHTTGTKHTTGTTTPPAPKFAGFTTGGGKAVNISHDAMREAGRFFDDSAEKPTAGSRLSRFRDDSVVKGKAPVTTASTSDGFGGFTTGSGTAVVVSEQAMAKARNVLDTPEQSKQAPPATSLFSTGSGKQVTVSSAAMAKAASMFGDADDVTGGVAAPSAEPSLFSTGSGKAVTVSAQAMAKAASVFSDEQPLQLPAPVPRLVAPVQLTSLPRRPLGGGASVASKGGFQSPMLAGVPRLPASNKRGTTIGDSNSNQATTKSPNRTNKSHGAPSVHDLFVGRKNTNRRLPIASYFQNLVPHERMPNVHGGNNSSITPQVLAMTADTALGYRVPAPDGSFVGPDDFYKRLIGKGCVPRLLDREWVRNAHRHIVWHHASVVRSFPESMTQGILTANSIETRLLYRYEREILNAKRPHLRRVWERDTPAGVSAVLVVSGIRKVPPFGGTLNAYTDYFSNAAVLEVSDGWYGVLARCDFALTNLVKQGRFFVGQKILIQGVELMPKQGEPCGPLSDDSYSQWLALRSNQVRPAPWDAKLGACRKSVAVPLRSITPDGGAIAKLIVFVERVYPCTWIESGRADGKVVHRSELAELKAVRRWDDARAVALEKLTHRGNDDDNDDDADQRVRDRLESDRLLERRSSRSMKLRVSGVRAMGAMDAYNGQRNSQHVLTGSALLTAYDVDEDASGSIHEGSVYELTDVNCRKGGSGGPGGPANLELIVNRRTSWRKISPSALALGKLASNPTPRRLCTARDLSDGYAHLGDTSGKICIGEEFDAVALVVYVSCSTPSHAPTSQWVFLADVSAVSTSFGSNGAAEIKPGAELLAVEIDARHPEAFVDAKEWGGGGGVAKGQNSTRPTPLFLENLRYMRCDAVNGVRVATFSDLSKATPMFSGALNGNKKSFPSGPNAPAAEKQARVLREAFGPGSGIGTDAFLSRVHALTGSEGQEVRSSEGQEVANEIPEKTPTTSVGVSTRRQSLRRKRSLSLGSDAEWGASQLDVIAQAEQKALEMRRQMRRGGETQ